LFDAWIALTTVVVVEADEHSFLRGHEPSNGLEPQLAQTSSPLKNGELITDPLSQEAGNGGALNSRSAGAQSIRRVAGRLVAAASLSSPRGYHSTMDDAAGRLEVSLGMGESAVRWFQGGTKRPECALSVQTEG